MAVSGRPDDVFRPERSVAAEEHPRMAGLEGDRGRPWAYPNARPTPGRQSRSIQGKGVFLADGAEHVVALMNSSGSPVGTSRRRPVSSYWASTFSKVMPTACRFQHESFRHQHVEDRNILAHGVFLFPRRGLHFLKAGAHDDLDALATEAAGGAAAIHGGVAAAKHDHALADVVMWPNETEDSQSMPMWKLAAASFAAWNIQVAAARRASADEHGVPVLVQHLFQGVDALGTKLMLPMSVM